MAYRTEREYLDNQQCVCGHLNVSHATPPDSTIGAGSCGFCECDEFFLRDKYMATTLKGDIVITGDHDKVVEDMRFPGFLYKMQVNGKWRFVGTIGMRQ